MSTTLFSRVSNMEYDPYLAQWPGLSALPSPAKTRPPSIVRSCSIMDVCWDSHVFSTTGNRNLFWWLSNVLLDMPASFMWLNNCCTFANWLPENNIAADNRRFPAGNLPMKGWLCQVRVKPQSGHLWYTATAVPNLFFWSVEKITVHVAVHNGQVWKSSSNSGRNTTNFSSSCGFADFLCETRGCLDKKNVKPGFLYHYL